MLASTLFRGDRLLEAAAISDAAHITPGAKGDHVIKIQLALIQLDGAKIDADGSYGPRTAAAVLAYKQSRNIINTAYQTTADNIVGRMTIASLDQELSAAPPTPVGRDVAELGAAILATLATMDRALVRNETFVSPRLRVRLELLRADAALTSRGNLFFGSELRSEYDRRSPHIAELGSPSRPIVFAAAPVVAAGAAITALEIAVATLALVLVLCVVSPDFRRFASRLMNEAIEAASDAIIDVISEVAAVDSMVQRCKNTAQNPGKDCTDRQKEYQDAKDNLNAARREASAALSAALSHLERVRFNLVHTQLL